MADISLTTFQMQAFPKGPVSNFLALVQLMAYKPLSEPMIV